jgi:ligand-binding sensor domain-containing protein
MRALLLILALASSAALAVGAAPQPAARPLYFEHLTVRDGLSQSTVMSFLQGSEGYLWLATESGLDRYDGYSIKEYRRQRGNEAALASDYIWDIAEDASHDLWLATVGQSERTTLEPCGSGLLALDSTAWIHARVT